MKDGIYILCIFCLGPTARTGKIETGPVDEQGRGSLILWNVYCYGCRAHGPEKTTEEGAITKWIEVISKLGLRHGGSKRIPQKKIKEYARALVSEG